MIIRDIATLVVLIAFGAVVIYGAQLVADLRSPTPTLEGRAA